MPMFHQELHSVYGAIPRDGEYVRNGDILGLSADSKEVVTAPVSGWVRLISTPGNPHGRLHVQIDAEPEDADNNAQ